MLKFRSSFECFDAALLSLYLGICTGKEKGNVGADLITERGFCSSESGLWDEFEVLLNLSVAWSIAKQLNA